MVAEQGLRDQIVQPHVTMETMLKRPGRGCLKVNWDATIDHQWVKVGMGIVALDHEGRVVAALCSSKPFHLSPTFVEAFVAWRIAEFCTTLDPGKILMEGDSLEVV